jgi:hypothetical protein
MTRRAGEITSNTWHGFGGAASFLHTVRGAADHPKHATDTPALRVRLTSLLVGEGRA